MAGYFWQVKAYLVSKGKSSDEADLILDDIGQVMLQDDGSGVYIKTWNVSGIDKPSDSDLTALDSTATGYENLKITYGLRISQYPVYGDQFDLLYHCIEADSDLKTKFASFYNAIKAVKDANPKS